MFDRAFDTFQEGDFVRAELMFKEVIEEDPSDHVAKIYLERCEGQGKHMSAERRQVYLA